ncbi:hypothetical protein GK107_15340 [Geobacillus thermoleovorans]|uniref:DUF2935 domain-containing protein n=1 Tax=Bacillus caldolyticus TaxID=1394 RepID=A0ABM6QNP7_BACCL|nr:MULTISPECIES: hypothetical protein [Geobacillus thermoleovorans group]AUI37185.1 hypothetical protein CWI35_12265 [[Bacillus] caldolyticus]UPT60634.1 hypothetical protein GK107_15340 [Geobacillus thermoleovorans]
MQLNIFGQTFEYRNDRSELEAMFQKIFSMIDEVDRQLSHLVIDGVEVYDDFETYVEERIDSIRTIDVVAVTIEEYIRDVFQTMHLYLTRALPEIERIIDEFYQTPSEHTWIRFEQMLEGIQWIDQALYWLTEHPKHSLDRQALARIRETLAEQLRQLLQAVEAGDTILIADLIQYEVKPLWKDIMEHVKVHVVN